MPDKSNLLPGISTLTLKYNRGNYSDFSDFFLFLRLLFSSYLTKSSKSPRKVTPKGILGRRVKSKPILRLRRICRLTAQPPAAKKSDTRRFSSLDIETSIIGALIVGQAAVDALKQSLLRNPGDLDAKENYIYAKKMLENQQQQQQNQQNDQNQDQNDQDQNDDQQNDQNQDQNQNDQDKQDDQNQNDQNQDQNDQNRNQQNGQQPKITPQAAQQMLQAIQAKEKETQEKVKKEKAQALQSRQRERNW